ncbi:MAG: histidine kinase N-terminal domain-containing protein [Acidobacteria bacterium]|nr:histidine kinase N-terminal domain-containing protein [Acidobacteriota bacterium]
MASLAELAAVHTDLSDDEIDHLLRLVASWGLLADLSFSDLLIFAPQRTQGTGPTGIVVLGQVRPSTSQTLFRRDWVGRQLALDERPAVLQALTERCMVEAEVTGDSGPSVVRETCIPIRRAGRTIAVLAKETAAHQSREPGELERTYLEVFERFATMIADGTFPFAADDDATDDAPRVGDGAIVLGADRTVHYASPNAVSALNRIGVLANSEGRRFGEIGLPESALLSMWSSRRPAAEEIEVGSSVTVRLRFIPLIAAGEVTGALVLMRDISELRRRDRMLLSKDATIREIHHRVKNNLQTISALLRLQGRRLSTDEAKAAIEESVRRIRSIALVHETLSHAAGDDVPFLEIVRPLVRMVEEGLVSAERPIRFVVTGDPGVLPSPVATSMAVVLAELLQNVVDHAYPSATLADALVRVSLSNVGDRLEVVVTDNGVGPPPGFTVQSSTGLGLSIVRTLVTTELRGSIAFAAAYGADELPGTEVRISVPVHG